jgi:hypothetical protein
MSAPEGVLAGDLRARTSRAISRQVRSSVLLDSPPVVAKATQCAYPPLRKWASLALIAHERLARPSHTLQMSLSGLRRTSQPTGSQFRDRPAARREWESPLIEPTTWTARSSQLLQEVGNNGARSAKGSPQIIVAPPARHQGGGGWCISTLSSSRRLVVEAAAMPHRHWSRDSSTHTARSALPRYRGELSWFGIIPPRSHRGAPGAPIRAEAIR